ncbi:hypothetical protein [Streptomyces olivochromogenes]|uniref:hypothetical protein n=1 Tax=Streptomyces olivochromogenes TaxID=1963 RepID=UPI003678F04F
MRFAAERNQELVDERARQGVLVEDWSPGQASKEFGELGLPGTSEPANQHDRGVISDAARPAPPCVDHTVSECLAVDVVRARSNAAECLPYGLWLFVVRLCSWDGKLCCGGLHGGISGQGSTEAKLRFIASIKSEIGPPVMGARVNRTFLVAPDGLEVRGNIEAVALCDFAEIFPHVFQGEPDLFAMLATERRPRPSATGATPEPARSASSGAVDMFCTTP